MTVFIVQPQAKLLEDFRDSSNNGASIAAFHGSTPVSLMLVSAPPRDFPLNAQYVSDNVVALLNGGKPAHEMKANDHELFYSVMPNGFSLHYREKDGGVSRQGMLFTISSDESFRDLRDEIMAKIKPEFMKAFFSAIEMNKQHTDVRPGHKNQEMAP